MDAGQRCKTSALIIFEKRVIFLLQSLSNEKTVESVKRDGCFSVGYSKVEIMPENIDSDKYWMAGFKTRNRINGVFDSLYASAVWIDNKSESGGIVLVSVDCLGLTGYDVEKVRAMLKEFCEISGCNSIDIIATHTHAGIDTVGIWGPLPKTGRNKKYMNIVYSGIVRCVKNAYENRRNGCLFFGYTDVRGIQNRGRTPYCIASKLKRIKFVPDDGSNEVWIVSFDMHPNSMGRFNSSVSADYPGYLRKNVKEKHNADLIYFAGAIGGVGTKREGDSPLQYAVAIGNLLTEKFDEINNETQISANIRYIKKECFFEVENPVLFLLGMFGIIKTNKCPTGGKFKRIKKSELTYLCIGEIEILMLPGEIFPELVYGGYLESEETANLTPPSINPLPLAKIAQNDELIIFGVANDLIGYIVPPNDFYLHNRYPYFVSAYDRLGRSHYNETNSLGPKTAQKIADVFLQIKNELIE